MKAKAGNNGGGPKAAKSMPKPGFEELASRVDRVREAWLEGGRALHKIIDGGLYKKHYSSVDKYLEGRHSFGRAYAYRLMDAAKAVEKIGKTSTEVDKIVAVSQAHAIWPFAKKDARRAAKLLEELAAEHGGVLPSARSIEAAVYREPGMGLAAESPASEVAQETILVHPKVGVGAAAKVMAKMGDTATKHPEGSFKRFAEGGQHSVERDERQKALARKRASAPPVATSRAGKDVFVHHGDFESFQVEPGRARLVFSDPPYNRAWADTYGQKHAEFAYAALEDGGFFVFYTGDACAWDLGKAAEAAGFQYYGFIWVSHGNGKDILHHPRKTVPGKLVWVFVKGTANLENPYRGIADNSDPTLKDDHEWQQALGDAEQIIEDFTAPGDLVIDPCLGSGTAAIAAGYLGRRAVGIEEDEATHRAAHRKVHRHLHMHSEFGRELADLSVKAVYEKLPFAEFENLCRERGITEERLREIGAESAAKREAHLERNPHERWQRPRTEMGQALLLASWGVSPSRARSAWRGGKGEAA